MSADSIARCKLALPMPELWHKLGLRGEPNRSCLSPFRDEKEPSFSVFQVGEHWFYKDHATGESGDEISLIVRHTGCEKSDAIQNYHVLAGITLTERKAKAPINTLGKLIKIYDYLDSDGKLLHQTLRFEPKRFLQRRPAAQGMHAGGKQARLDKRTGQWWIWTLEGIEPVLYHLPRILAAPEDCIIVICEGEKDADALWEDSAGVDGCPDFVTTTAPMGAGKWRKSYTETLSDKRVIVWPHRDVAGQAHMQRVTLELKPIVKALFVMNWRKLWPEAFDDPSQKLDIADYLAFRARNATQ